MTGQPVRRAVAVLAAAALTATLASTALAAEVDPAAKKKPVVRCAGKVATKVGTPGRDIIRGTAKRDIIAGLGGHDRIDGRGGNDLICAGPGHDLVIGGTGIDRIYGQAGRDRLYGGPGPDILFGQVGNDRLNGGTGVDTCHQGPGAGRKVSCERPLPPPVAVPAPPTPPPPVAAPAPPPTPKVLARAYTDMNANGVFDAGDVLISELVDTNLDGVPSKDDTVVMGRWPTNPSPEPTHFGDWMIKRHRVETPFSVTRGRYLGVRTTAGDYLTWRHYPPGSGTYLPGERYVEEVNSPVEDPPNSLFYDAFGPKEDDSVWVNPHSPSRPGVLLAYSLAEPRGDDDYFLEVDIFY